MRLELRKSTPWWLSLSAPILAITLSLLLASLLIVWAGESVIEAFRAMAVGAFGSTFALTETLSRAIPLTLTGLAAAIAFRARFYNIGAEGQLYCGALAATLIGSGFLDLPSSVLIPLLFIASTGATHAPACRYVFRFGRRVLPVVAAPIQCVWIQCQGTRA